MYFNLQNKNFKRPLFKKRFLKNTNYKFIRNAVFFKNKTFIELSFFKKILFRLKRIYKKKKVSIYINIHRNHMLSKKPKNARMGKGKGKFTRFIYKSHPFRPVIYVPIISKSRIIKINDSLNYKNTFIS